MPSKDLKESMHRFSFGQEWFDTVISMDWAIQINKERKKHFCILYGSIYYGAVTRGGGGLYTN